MFLNNFLKNFIFPMLLVILVSIFKEKNKSSTQCAYTVFFSPLY